MPPAAGTVQSDRTPACARLVADGGELLRGRPAEFGRRRARPRAGSSCSSRRGATVCPTLRVQLLTTSSRAPPSSGSLAPPARSSPPRELALLQTEGSCCVTDAPSSAADERVLTQARLAPADGEPPCARRYEFSHRQPRPRTCSPCCCHTDTPSSAAEDGVPARARLATAARWEPEGDAVEEAWRWRGAAAAREDGRARIGETHTRAGIGPRVSPRALVLSPTTTPLASSRRGRNNSLSQACGPARTWTHLSATHSASLGVEK